MTTVAEEEISMRDAAFEVGQFINWYQNQANVVQSVGPNLANIHAGLQRCDAFLRKKQPKSAKKSKARAAQWDDDQDQFEEQEQEQEEEDDTKMEEQE